MTLYKQMALLFSITLLIILSAIMTLSFLNAKHAAIQSLRENAKNTSQTLATQLSDTMGDEVLIEMKITSNYSGGYFTLIQLRDLNNSEIFGCTPSECAAEQPKHDTPQWFKEMLHIKAPEASSQVSSGWSNLGILYVKGDPSFAYDQLYGTFKDLLISFSIIAVISLLILNYLLHIVLKPLKKVQNQAESIMKNQFILQERLPFTTEFKDVVKGMNAMVTRVKEVFEKGNEAMARNQELMYNDPVTKLFNRRYLMLKLPDLLERANEADGGMMMLVSLDGAENVNKKLGRQRADDFFKQLGSVFMEQSEDFDDSIVSRVNGTEFAIILPGCTSTQGSDIARDMNATVEAVKKANELEADDVYINIGLYRYATGQDIPTVMTNADNALTYAKANENDNTYLFDIQDSKNAMGKEQWRQIIEKAMERRWIDLDFWPVFDTKRAAIIHKVMTFGIHDNSGNSYPYGSFAPQAISLGLLPEMYLKTLESLFINPPKASAASTYSVRLSSEFLRAPHSYENLKALFERYAKQTNVSLAFEISDAIILQHLEIVLQFDALFDSFGFKVGINQFTAQSKNYAYLQEIRPDFIKADVAYLIDQGSEGMQAFEMITKTMGIHLIATGVRDESQLDALKTLDITTIQGILAETLSQQ